MQNNKQNEATPSNIKQYIRYFTMLLEVLIWKSVCTKTSNVGTFGVANAHAWEAPALRRGARVVMMSSFVKMKMNRASADTAPKHRSV